MQPLYYDPRNCSNTALNSWSKRAASVQTPLKVFQLSANSPAYFKYISRFFVLPETSRLRLGFPRSRVSGCFRHSKFSFSRTGSSGKSPTTTQASSAFDGVQITVCGGVSCSPIQRKTTLRNRFVVADGGGQSVGPSTTKATRGGSDIGDPAQVPHHP